MRLSALLPLSLSLLLLASLLAACAQEPPSLSEEEQIRQQSFIQDLLDENTRLREEQSQLQDILLQNEAVLSSQNETIRRYLEELRKLNAQPEERLSPSARIPIDEIKVYGSEVIINVPGLMPALVADTNSMDPLVDSDSKLLVVTPKDEREIHLGDIVGYVCSACTGEIVMHRVIAMGRDAEGAFFIMKGDNNPAPDPDRVRFSQIRTVVVGIIY